MSKTCSRFYLHLLVNVEHIFLNMVMLENIHLNPLYSYLRASTILRKTMHDV